MIKCFSAYTFSNRLFAYKYILFSIVFLLFLGHTYANVQNDPPDKKFTVVLDAGHGGKDPGNSHHGFIEKNIALGVVLKIGKILEKNPEINVIYTRKTDVFVTLEGRAEKANKNKADLFVSVHLNSYDGHTAHGPETYVLGTYRNKDNLDIAMKENSVITLEENYEETYNNFDPKNPASYIGMTLMQEEYLTQSIFLADLIQKQFTNSLHRFDRGVKQAGFLVIRETYMPGVLIELGFLTNPAEGRYLNSAHGQQEMAAAIAQGIIKYKNTLNLDASNTDYNKDADVAKSDIIFRIQIAAGSKPLKTASYNFNGLEGVERIKDADLYKYYYGKTSDYVKIQASRQEAIDKGYLKSYIVAFKNGQKIDVDTALKDMAK